MSRKKGIIIGIVIAAVAIPLGIYTALPLFINTEINEPLPTLSNGNNNDMAAMQQQFKDFMEMTEEERIEKGQQMSNEERDMIMKAAAQTNGTTVNEQMTTIGEETSTTYSGTFVGVNDGIHNAEGQAKVIKLGDGSNFLRLEDFRSTNGPDLYVYLSTDKGNSDFVNLGRLKGNVGDQNYKIPEGTDLSKYDTALIWCQAFSVLFGSAELRPMTAL
ncbi:MAG: DM13 domain-containing protein [Thermoproteota archaeon]|nr:DM13 domain-containing protein [Thermoproteota archaeon]